MSLDTKNEAIFAVGVGWRKARWNHTMERTTADIAEERGSDR